MTRSRSLVRIAGALVVGAVVVAAVPALRADSGVKKRHAGPSKAGVPQVVARPARDTFHTYVVHLIAGRTDRTTPRAGALTVWVDGVNTPVIKLRNINTLQRYGGITQKWMQLWEGDYTQNLPIVARSQFVLTRVGRTLAEALADRPTTIGTTAHDQRYRGSGVDLGPPSAKRLRSRSADRARIPSGLGGNTSPADPLESWEITLTPNYVSPKDDAASNYQGVWVYGKSPTTPYRSPDSARQQSRYLLLDPRSQDSDGRVGQDEWWFVIERSWPSDFDPSRHGNWGRMVNFHNVAGDVGWNTGSGVSALALDWLSSAPAPQFTVEYHDGGKPHYLVAARRTTP